MKTLATNEPQRATELLQQAPQLGYAVCEALLLMGLVTPNAISSIVEPGAPPAAIPQPAAYGQPAAMPSYMGAPVANNTPPTAANPYAPPPAAAAPAPIQDTETLMRMVMELPQSEIDKLPAAEKDQILALRAQFGGVGR
jgi:cleavage stimulation factor subunit 2